MRFEFVIPVSVELRAGQPVNEHGQRLCMIFVLLGSGFNDIKMFTHRGPLKS